MRNRLDPSPTDPPPLVLHSLVPLLLVFLAACSDTERRASSSAELPPTLPGSAQQADATVGDVSFFAVAMQTSQIPATVAAEHGIERRDDLVMLRVSPRQGEPGNIASAQAVVKATVTDLRGHTSVVELDRKVVAGLVDYVATMEVKLPATLRFEITATTPSGESETMRLSHEFRAR